MEQIKKINILNGNTLKIVAAICMLLDHIGYILLPEIEFLRVIGRIAFPIFAYFIAEGCKYTKNKLKYFSIIFVLGIIFQLVYYVVEGGIYDVNIFITFSLSVAIIYALQYFKYNIFNKNGIALIVVSGLMFLISIIVAFFVCVAIPVDYGFWGVMLPVFAALFHYKGDNKTLKKLDSLWLSILAFSIGLVLLCVFSPWQIQYYSLASILLLLLYSGERGKTNLKYFFYIFYPAHLVVLYGIGLLIY